MGQQGTDLGRRPGITRRACITLLTVSAVVVTGFCLFAVDVFIGLGQCGGDGGTPHAAPGTLATSYCDSSTAQNVQTVLGFAILGLLVAAGARAVRRDAWRPLLTAILLAVPLVVIFAAPAFLPY